MYLIHIIQLEINIQTINIKEYWHKENDGLITLALFGDRERELIKSGLGLDLTGGDGME